jgi:hypothetical protein
MSYRMSGRFYRSLLAATFLTAVVFGFALGQSAKASNDNPDLADVYTDGVQKCAALAAGRRFTFDVEGSKLQGFTAQCKILPPKKIMQGG